VVVFTPYGSLFNENFALTSQGNFGSEGLYTFIQLCQYRRRFFFGQQIDKPIDGKIPLKQSGNSQDFAGIT
jgi:hypothetical protein